MPPDDLIPFLGSLQLADSFFPSGLYALSHGLETFAQVAHLDTETLTALLGDYLRHGIGLTDGIALACAHRAAGDNDLDLAERADARLTAVKLPREARETSLRTGRQLLKLAAQTFGGDVLRDYGTRAERGTAPANHAVVLGLALATLGIPRDRAIAGELYAVATSCVAATVRLAAIDHRAAQQGLHRLKPVIAGIALDVCDKDVGEIGGCVPLMDIMAMRHEHADVRLFMS